MHTLLEFIKSVCDLIVRHDLVIAFMVAVMISALPKPGTPWNTYEYVYTVLNGWAANLPTKGKSAPYIQTLDLNKEATK